MDTSQLIAAKNKLYKFTENYNLPPADVAKYVAKCAKAHATLAEYELQWKEWLRDSYGEGFTEAQHQLVFHKAWDLGIRFGYQEVESAYTELKSFLTDFNASA